MTFTAFVLLSIFFSPYATAIFDSKKIDTPSYLKSRHPVFLEQLLVCVIEEWNHGLLVRRRDHVTQRHVLETFVLTDIVI